MPRSITWEPEAAQVVRWARSHPDDPRVPEALYRAIRSSRFGPADAETGKYSRQAFALLKGRYGRTEWASRTKYWYR